MTHHAERFAESFVVFAPDQVLGQGVQIAERWCERVSLSVCVCVCARERRAVRLSARQVVKIELCRGESHLQSILKPHFRHTLCGLTPGVHAPFLLRKRYFHFLHFVFFLILLSWKCACVCVCACAYGYIGERVWTHRLALAAGQTRRQVENPGCLCVCVCV